jgi:hypothetical protein
MALDSVDNFDAVFSKRVSDWLAPSEERLSDLALSNKLIVDQLPGLFSALRPPRPLPPFRDFLLSRVWATNGALELKVPPGFVHTKAGYAFTASDDELWAWWLQHRNDPEDSDVFIKGDETASFRLVVRTSMQTYLKMAYTNLDFTAALGTDPRFWTLRDQADKLKDLTHYQAKLADGYYSINCDGSGWDEGIGRSITGAFFRLKVQRYSQADPDAALASLPDQVAAGMLSLPDGRRLPYLNGVLSGWGDTLVINSFVNVALMSIANHGAQETVYFVQGDDNTTLSRQAPDMEKFAAAYEAVGFKLNRSKSSVFRGLYEFLKIVVTPFRAAGFPVRSLRAILFGSADERDGGNPFFQRADLWIKYFGRIEADPNDELLLRFVHRDINNAVPRSARLTWALFADWWNSPRSLGGAGLGDKPIRWTFEYTTDQRTLHGLVTPPIPTSFRSVHLPAQLLARGWDAKIAQLRDHRTRPSKPVLAGIHSTIVRLPNFARVIAFHYAHTDLFSLRMPLSALKTAFSVALDGCRNWQDAKTVIASIAPSYPVLAAKALQLGSRYATPLALDIIKGTYPSAFDPKIATRSGELIAELCAPAALRAALRFAPRRASREQLDLILASLTTVPA